MLRTAANKIAAGVNVGLRTLLGPPSRLDMALCKQLPSL